MAGLAGMGISTPSEFDGSNVNDQLGATLNKGGLLMRMAQSRGQGIASQRGLSNSTIGIDAAQRAVVDAALPIAQQNAQQTHQRVMQGSDQQQQITMLDKQQGWQGNQNSLDRQQQLNMQSNQFGQDKNMANLNASLQKQRDDLLYKQQLGTLDKQGQLELQQLDKQLSNQKVLNEQQNTYNSAEAQKDRAQQLTLLEKNASKDLAYMAQQVAANTHGMYLSAIDSQVTGYNERVSALEVAQDIKTTDKLAMKAGMEKELNATLQMYGQIYSNINTIRPDWTQFPTKVLPTVGAGKVVATGAQVAAPIKQTW